MHTPLLIPQSANDLEGAFPYPIIADPTREYAVKLGMLDPVEKDAAGIPLTARAVRFKALRWL